MDSHSNSPPPPTTHQDNARDHDHEPLSPVFADSAIDMDVSPPPPPPLSHVPDDETLERTVRLADRLADLAHRTADKKNTATDTGGNSSRFSKDDAVVLQRCLDTIQKTLLVFDEDEDGDHDDIKEKVGDDEEKDDYDPRPGLTHELTKYRRPQSPTTTSIVKAETETQPASSSSPQPPPSLSENSNDATTEIAEQRERQPQQEKQFTALLDEVSTLGSELDQRRNESFYIYNLFTSQTQRLERRVSLLEDEIRELLVYTYHCIGNWCFYAGDGFANMNLSRQTRRHPAKFNRARRSPGNGLRAGKLGGWVSARSSTSGCN